MKRLTTLFILLVALGSAKAQTGASASQAAHLALSDAIDISIITASTINIQFNTVNDYANGVESDNHTLKIRSNKKYNIRVKVQSSKFAYSGATTPAPSMSSTSVLKVKITANNTGGTLGSGFTSYKSMSTSGAKIINNATAGGNSTFSVKYQATPGFSYPAGNYSVDVVYTATQA